MSRLNPHEIREIQQKLLSDRNHQQTLMKMLEGNEETHPLSHYFSVSGWIFKKTASGDPILTIYQEISNPFFISINSEVGQPAIIQVCDRAWRFARIRFIEVIEGMTMYSISRNMLSPGHSWSIRTHSIAAKL